MAPNLGGAPIPKNQRLGDGSQFGRGSKYRKPGFGRGSDSRKPTHMIGLPSWERLRFQKPAHMIGLPSWERLQTQKAKTWERLQTQKNPVFRVQFAPFQCSSPQFRSVSPRFGAIRPSSEDFLPVLGQFVPVQRIFSPFLEVRPCSGDSSPARCFTANKSEVGDARILETLP